jgi:hypothetical protein
MLLAWLESGTTPAPPAELGSQIERVLRWFGNLSTLSKTNGRMRDITGPSGTSSCGSMSGGGTSGILAHGMVHCRLVVSANA